MKLLIWDNNVWRYCKYYIVMSPIFNSFFNMIKSNIVLIGGYHDQMVVGFTTTCAISAYHH